MWKEVSAKVCIYFADMSINLQVLYEQKGNNYGK